MSRFIRITETDPGYIEGFTEYLVSLGAKQMEDPLLLEVPDDLNTGVLHGIEEFDPSEAPFHERYADEVAWLNAYTGTFPFYVSLKQQLASKGKLSEMQIEAVRRAIARDHERSQRKPDPAQFSIKSGQCIRVSKGFAKEIAERAGLTRPHYVMEVIACESETERAYKLRLKLSAHRTTHCCICGLLLTNAESVSAGIGPICAEKVSVSFSTNALQELSSQLKTTQEVSTWIPKRAIKEVL